MSAPPLPTVLIAQAGGGARDAMAAALSGLADVVVAGDEGEALRLMHEHDVQAVVCGPCPRGTSCTGLLARIAEGWPDRRLRKPPSAQALWRASLHVAARTGPVSRRSRRASSRRRSCA